MDAYNVGKSVQPGDYEAIVYDLDGTLVDLDVDWDAARDEVAALLNARGVEFENDDDLWEMLAVAEAEGHGVAVEARLAERERSGADSATRLALADDLPHDVPVGVCSLNCEDACRIALELHGLDAHVDAVVGRDSHERRKPDPDPLLAAIDALDADPRRSLFVGDSENDATAAERAGVDFQWVRERAEKR